MTLGEVNAAGEYIASRVDRKAIIFFGMVNNEKMADHVRLTLIATGIPESQNIMRGPVSGNYVRLGSPRQ
jgi:cell division GTPase FtsZ